MPSQATWYFKVITPSCRSNSANYGTGISLTQNSRLFLKQDTYILFADNQANSVGGAMFTESSFPIPLQVNPVCFFQVDKDGFSNDPVSTIKIDFVNNTAYYAGSSFYGVYVSGCASMAGKISGSDVFNRIFSIANTELDPSAAAADPDSVCICLNGHHKPDCSIHNHAISTFPGGNFTLRLATVGGTMSGTVPGAIHAFFHNSFPNTSFGPLQDSQMQDKAYCSDFTYTVLTTYKSVYFFVAAVRLSFTPYDLAVLPNITVYLDDCPLGFTLSHDMGKCVCDPVISRNDIHCYINNQSILRPAYTWIGFISDISSGLNVTGVLFHDHCPYGHCLGHNVYLNSSNTRTQCEAHRTGLLCGMCEGGYSLTLGNEKCSKCSNKFLLLLLPLAAAGLVLVALLFALNLTVTEGSINGLIFYANVMEMTHSNLNLETSSSLHVFVAWLNLDLGIDACFFDGMDAYTKTWLQFAFPLYLWAIIIIIVILCNKFPTLAASTAGKNSVKVLATLLLLSYTKLQRTVVTVFSFTSLQYPNGAVYYVWLYNANVQFLKGKHLYLYIAGMIVLVLLIVPYTLCLALFQQLQACSRHRAFWWVNKLKPVFDSYAGPYKDRYRVWTGLLLVTRTLLIVLFSFNISNSPDFNLFVILMVSLILLLLTAISRGIYKKWAYDVLESFFYLQLGVFAGAVMYARHNRGRVCVVSDVSIGMTLVVFLVIVGYHGFSCVPSSFRKVYHRYCKGYDDIEDEEPLLFHERDGIVVNPSLTMNRPCE